MFYQENLNLDDQHYQIPYSSLQNDDLPTVQPPQYGSFNDYEVYNKHEHSSNNQFQIFGNESFHTISRISLQMLPDPYAMQINQEKCQVLHKHSNSSIYMESDNEDGTELETKLVTQTRQLSIDQKKQEEGNQFQYTSLGSSLKDISKNQKSSKIFSTKHIKNLLKEVKRRYRYQEKVKGSFKIRLGQQILQLNDGYIRPILQKKGGISGMIIESNDKMVKLRVNSEVASKTQIHLQFWREVEQSWVQATISAKLKL